MKLKIIFSYLIFLGLMSGLYASCDLFDPVNDTDQEDFDESVDALVPVLKKDTVSILRKNSSSESLEVPAIDLLRQDSTLFQVGSGQVVFNGDCELDRTDIVEIESCEGEKLVISTKPLNSSTKAELFEQGSPVLIPMTYSVSSIPSADTIIPSEEETLFINVSRDGECIFKEAPNEIKFNGDPIDVEYNQVVYEAVIENPGDLNVNLTIQTIPSFFDRIERIDPPGDDIMPGESVPLPSGNNRINFHVTPNTGMEDSDPFVFVCQGQEDPITNQFTVIQKVVEPVISEVDFERISDGPPVMYDNTVERASDMRLTFTATGLINGSQMKFECPNTSLPDPLPIINPVSGEGVIEVDPSIAPGATCTLSVINPGDLRDNAEGPYSESITVVDNIPPDVPGTPTVSEETAPENNFVPTGALEVCWDKPDQEENDDLDRFILSRSSDGVTDTLHVAYEDNGKSKACISDSGPFISGNSYTYEVKSVDVSGNESANSASSNAFAYTVIVPQINWNLANIEGQDTKVKLEWIFPPSPRIEAFYIFRDEMQNTLPENVGDNIRVINVDSLKNPNELDLCVFNDATKNVTCSITDTGLTNGVQYNYYIFAYRNAGGNEIWSVASDEIQVTPNDGQAPNGEFSNLGINQGAIEQDGDMYKIPLKWDFEIKTQLDVEDNQDIERFILYRRKGNDELPPDYREEMVVLEDQDDRGLIVEDPDEDLIILEARRLELLNNPGTAITFNFEDFIPVPPDGTEDKYYYWVNIVDDDGLQRSNPTPFVTTVTVQGN